MSKSVIRPQLATVLATVVLVGAGIILALAGLGDEDGFTPRVKTIDALAGLVIGAMFVDRLLTFMPVFLIRKEPDARQIDLDYLRLGYGALLGGLFVSVTDLRAIGPLTTSEDVRVIDPDVDRVIATLVIAGGVVGLSRIYDAVNPKKDTDGTKTATTAVGAPETIPPPTVLVRILGLAALGVVALLAWTCLVDRNTASLFVSETGADGSVSLVIRFGAVIVAAAVIEELIEKTLARAYDVKHNKPIVTGAVALLLALVAAWILDLLLLHNVGFFGPGTNPNEPLQNSTDLEIWFDVVATAVIIASGTKPLHDLASRLRKVKDPTTGRPAGPPPPPTEPVTRAATDTRPG